MPHVILVRLFGGWAIYGPFQNLLEAERHIAENISSRGLLTSRNWEVLQLRAPVELEMKSQEVRHGRASDGSP